MAKKMPSFGSQGTAAPVNTAQPIKAGTPVDWENRPTQTQGEVKAGIQVPGVGNNDKRKAK